MKNIVYLHEGGPDFASYRYRAEIPRHHIKGFTTQINEGEADILVLSKPSPLTLSIAEEGKRRGVGIVVDVCDDHLDTDVYQRAIAIADAVVACSKPLAEKTDGVVIPDPYEFEIAPPHVAGMRAMWFGRFAYMNTIAHWFPYLHKLVDGITIVCDTNTTVPHVPWSRENMARIGAASDIALLPNCGEKKSANRLVNAIALGMFPVTNETPAHLEFQDMCWVGKIANGLQFARAENSRLNKLVAEAQGYIKERYSPEAVGAMWQQVFDSI